MFQRFALGRTNRELSKNIQPYGCCFAYPGQFIRAAADSLNQSVSNSTHDTHEN